MSDTLLAFNAGSSSLKFGLFGADGERLHLRGSVTGLHDPNPHFVARDAAGQLVTDEHWPQSDAHGGVERLILWIEQHLGRDRLVAAGHRVVHGGSTFTQPVIVDPAVLRQLDALSPLAPLHQPASLLPIRELAAFRPGVLQVACFDTAFHHDLEPPASRYALPRALEQEGIRRYGFHGLSYEAIVRQLVAGDDGAEKRRIIVAHLGSGASLCALRELRSVDTTMGFSTLDGLVMGTRPGALDPGILLYLMRTKGYGVDELEDLLYHQSGLLGVSGISGEVETLLESDDPAAAEAIELFAFSVSRQIAALATTLAGLDQVIFTGGIGEHSWQVRAAIVARMRWMGIELDDAANRGGASLISTPTSTATVGVASTDEEGVIARHTSRLLVAPPEVTHH